MTPITACRACLSSDVMLFTANDSNTHEVYKHLTGIVFDCGFNKPLMFCCKCYYHMQRVVWFRDLCLRADGVLNQLLGSNDGLTQETLSKIDRESCNLVSRLTPSLVETISILPDATFGKENEIKSDKDDHSDSNDVERKTELLVNLKTEIEVDLNEVKEEDCDLVSFDDVASDSEDDLPLTSLSVKKPPKHRKANVKDSRRNGFKEEFAKEIILSKEEQIAELQERSKSANYLQSPYKCPLCFKGYLDDLTFKNHMEKHDPSSGRFQCAVCCTRHRTERQLRAHTSCAHARRYLCLRCGHRAHTAHQARSHERWHRGEFYACKLCGQKFNKPTSLLTHLRSKHVSSEHACTVCGDSFLGSHGLRMHLGKTNCAQLTEISGSEKERLCTECDILFNSAEAWKRHMVTSIKHVLNSRESDTCIVCGNRFDTRTELSQHMREHRPKRAASVATPAVKVPCDSCDRVFSSRAKLQAHTKRIHLGMKYDKHLVCEVCGKHCTSQATLKYHQRTHSGEKPYACTGCPKRFPNRNQLRIHARTHSGERPYRCRLCDKTFTQKPALNRHSRVHTGIKPYPCQYCGKAFTQSNSLKLHVRTVHHKLPPAVKKSKKCGKLEESAVLVAL